jgi:hypothetical protein
MAGRFHDDASELDSQTRSSDVEPNPSRRRAAHGQPMLGMAASDRLGANRHLVSRYIGLDCPIRWEPSAFERLVARHRPAAAGVPPLHPEIDAGSGIGGVSVLAQ